MLENIRLSFRGIWSHKMRSFLTMLGIIIGIAAIIAIVSTIQGTNDQIEKNLIGSGSNNVKVTLQKDGYDIDLSYDSVPAGITEVSDSTLDQIKGYRSCGKCFAVQKQTGLWRCLLSEYYSVRWNGARYRFRLF